MRQLEAAVNRSRDTNYPHMQPPFRHLHFHPVWVGVGGRDADFVMSATVNHRGVLETRPPARQQQVFE